MAMGDFNIAESMLRKGIQFKIKSGELTEAQADEILKPFGGLNKEKQK